MAETGTRIDRLTLLLIAGIAAAAAIAFWPLAGALFVAGTFAIVLMPLHRVLCRRMPAWFSALLLTGGLVSALAALLVLLAGVLLENTNEILHMLQTIVSWAGSLLSRHVDLNAAGAVIDINAWLAEIVGLAEQSLMGIIPQVPLMVVDIIVFVLALYIAVLGGDKIYREVAAALPKRSQRGINALTVTFTDTIYSVYVLHVIVALVTFVLAVPFFAILGFGDVFFYAALAAIFQLIPAVGSLVLIVFLAVYALASGDYRALALLVFVGYPLLSALPDFFLRPILMGKRVDIHPVLVLIGFIGGLGVMGLIGFVLGPLFMALLVSGYHVLVEELHGAAHENAPLPDRKEFGDGTAAGE
ncbi:hypothetical protein ABH15_00490 [Methanoculleus taiwanensis]|uniref:Permease n=1 Tax=Methanoculleus taiwanensis TaxID=1550565 RepID=A0A498H2J6_9EURY|nr:AI-2E family transporter [Methanoculleus taiwanensis]RXE56697.1 hypothetical protein ABH15_00490 [Methanoculleus taiwanensis]